MTTITREQLIEQIVLCGEQERKVELIQLTQPFSERWTPLANNWCLVAIQKLQKNAIILDELLEQMDTNPDKTVYRDSIPSEPVEFTRLNFLKEYDDTVNNRLEFVFAIQNKRLGLLDLLLFDERVDPAEKDQWAIQTASKLGHLAVVDRLLQDPRVDPSTIDNWAIKMASIHGHLAVVDRLLQDPRVDPSANDNYAIRWASENGQLAVVDRLLQDPRVDPSAWNNIAIKSAINNDHEAVARRLLRDPRVDLSPYLAFYLSSDYVLYDPRFISYLLQKKDEPRLNPANNNNYVIRMASSVGNLGLVERLLRDSRVDPSADSNFAIRWASKNGHLRVVNCLLQDPRVDPSACKNEAIRWAFENGHLAVVNRLLKDKRIKLPWLLYTQMCASVWFRKA